MPKETRQSSSKNKSPPVGSPGSSESRGALDMLAFAASGSSKKEEDALFTSDPAKEHAYRDDEDDGEGAREGEGEGEGEEAGAVAEVGNGCVDAKQGGDSDYCRGKLIQCKKFDGRWRCEFILERRCLPTERPTPLVPLSVARAGKRHYDRVNANARTTRQVAAEAEQTVMEQDYAAVATAAGAYEGVEEPQLAEEEETGYAGPAAYAQSYDPAAYDPSAYQAYYAAYQPAQQAQEPAYGYRDDPGEESPNEDYGDDEAVAQLLVPAPPGRSVPANQRQQGGTNSLRKNSIKATCRPTVPENHQRCRAQDVYGEWIGTGGKYRLPVRIVRVNEAAKTMTGEGEELKHLSGCGMVRMLFPNLPGDTRCRQCGTVFSTPFNAASHGICRDNHFRCPPCGKAVTTLAAIQKHFKTPRHMAAMEGWTVDGVLKSTKDLETVSNSEWSF